MNGIRRKLRSQRGASITMALLVFLVCTMVSSVVIVAATTASGRLSRLAESDQRYYAVNSAAELLCKIFVTDETAATPVQMTCDTSSGQVTDPVAAPAGVDSLVFEADRLVATALVSKADSELVELDLTATEAGNTRDLLHCTLTQQALKNGLLVMKVQNYSGPKYGLEIVFASDVTKGAATGGSTETLTVNGWKLHSIRKLRADEVQTT